jgi:hypothetical protein
MARRIPLRSVEMPGVTNGKDGGWQSFEYGSLMQSILVSPPAGGTGVTYAEMDRVLQAKRPIDEAIEKRQDHVILSEEQWKTLNDRLTGFQFGLAHEALFAFGSAIRNAPELGQEKG